MLPSTLRFVFQHHFQTSVLLQETTTKLTHQMSLYQTCSTNSSMDHQDAFLILTGKNVSLQEQHQDTFPFLKYIHSSSKLILEYLEDTPKNSRLHAQTVLPTSILQVRHLSLRLVNHQPFKLPLEFLPRTMIQPSQTRLSLSNQLQLSSLVPSASTGQAALFQDRILCQLQTLTHSPSQQTSPDSVDTLDHSQSHVLTTTLIQPPIPPPKHNSLRPVIQHQSMLLYQNKTTTQPTKLPSSFLIHLRNSSRPQNVRTGIDVSSNTHHHTSP